MIRGVFITGTDTGCGKTHVAAALIRGLREVGLRVACLKPVAAGAARRDGLLRNDDALTLRSAAATDADYDLSNPYCFEPPVSPHIAATEAGVEIRCTRILDVAARLARTADLLVVEGAGGWYVPLSDGLDVADLAGAMGYPVVFVVGLRLGCINHARLTERAIRDSGVPLLGWVASQVDPQMARLAQNITTLRERLESPCLGILYSGGTPGDGRSHLDITALADVDFPP